VTINSYKSKIIRNKNLHSHQPLDQVEIDAKFSKLKIKEIIRANPDKSVKKIYTEQEGLIMQ
jgi:hypothetical protein